MKKIYVTIFLAGVLHGCANTPMDNYIKNENFAEAYSLAVNAPMWRNERSRITKSVFSETAGARSDIFYKSCLSHFRKYDNNNTQFYTESLHLIGEATKDELLNIIQAENLTKELHDILENSSIFNPKLLESEELKKFLASRGGNTIARAEKNLNLMIENKEDRLEKYLTIYKYFVTHEDIKNQKKTTTAMRDVVSRLLKYGPNKNRSLEDFKPILEYVRFMEDRSFDGNITRALSAAYLSRRDIKPLPLN